MTNDQEQESTVIRRDLMSPRRIRLNTIGVVAFAGLVFWISSTLPEPFNSRYSWIGAIGFVGSAILAVWGFIIAQRRQWWIDEQNKVSGEDQQ